MNRTVLITGAAGGIGQATARTFFDAGWHVIGVDNREMSGISCLHEGICADVSIVESWEKISAKVKHNCGRLDVLVNNAAMQICKPLTTTTPQEWDTVMAVNVRSSYLAVYHLHSLMSNRGGAVVNVSSVHALATSANIAAYAASKGALTALTRALAIELAPDRIRVNAVLPGAVNTRMLLAGLERGHLPGDNIDGLMNVLAGKTVMKRIGTSQEIAQAIFFLADDERSSFVTGQCLVIDGGAIARLSTE
jgi:NAD(P)-dependent dehydrogenase (short-subunit alcohol dehydrogenase family)